MPISIDFMPKVKKNLALIGLGYWGKNIFRNLNELGALHTACDIDPKLLKEFKCEYPDICYANSTEPVLSDPEIEGVLIATPAVSHFMLVKKALNAGKDVFVEKPIALTVKEAEELSDLARKKKRILMVGHILQYHPAVIKLKEMLSLGGLGKIRYVYSNRLNIGKLRTEENILWSFAPHDISAILMLLEEEPVRVSAFGGDYLNAGINDVTLTTMEFREGVKGHVFVSWLHPYKEQKLVVVGSKAMAVFDDLTKEKLFLYPHIIKWKDGKMPVAQKADFQVIDVSTNEPLRLELEHFIDCIETRKEPKTDSLEGVRVLKVLEAAESALLNKKEAAVKLKDDTKSVFVHETAFVDENVVVGNGTKIWHFSHIIKNSRIGKNCVIGQNVAIGPDVVIGDKCKIQNNVSIYKGVTLEDEVFCGPSCVFTNVYNPRAFVERKNEFMRTLVKRGATVGANATIVCGITIGKYAFIGAGAVVKKDVPEFSIVAGVPARQIGWICKCGATLKISGREKVACKRCSSKYRLNKNKLINVDAGH